TFYGPERFTRSTGAPTTVTRTISTAGYQAPFTLRVVNGTGGNAVTSGSIRLDGVEILGPGDFKKSMGALAIPVTVGATATLQVTLASKPGSYVDVALDGVPSATLFCPTTMQGAYTDLQAAVNATDPGGTIVVCDGTHDVDSVVVDRPLTIRSQHPGGATIGDSYTGPFGQGGRPAIAINGYTAGTVRFADIGFAANGTAIQALGTFDQIEIDSVHFTGRDSTTSFLVRVGASTEASARVEVTNSSFEHMTIGIFAISDVEVNVRHSSFNRFLSGSVTHSSGGVGGFRSRGTIEYSTFTNCWGVGCIRSFGDRITIRHNYIDASAPASRPFAVFYNRTNPPDANSQPYVFEDNTIVANPLPGSPLVATSYAQQSGVNLVDPGALAAEIHRNTIGTVFTGVVISNGGSLNMTDNVITGGVFAFNRTSPLGSVTVTRNDFNGLLGSFRTANSATPGPANYQCNWWGASGPLAPAVTGPALPASTYTPWAATPIANQPAVTCP
ncbi:MAG TPA: hypothetical protein VG916_01410, partial [Gemmatimonadaceae bacterium]|nr:hypothetical protein [Gemmatimonadaceae bacterium]